MTTALRPSHLRSSKYISHPALSVRCYSQPSSLVSIALSLGSIVIISFFPVSTGPDATETPHGRRLVVALLLSLCYSAATALVAALWQHAAAATAAPLVRYLSSGAVKTVVGPGATALVWLVFWLSLVTGAMSLRAIHVMAWQQSRYDVGSATSGSMLDLRVSEWRSRGRDASDVEMSTLGSTST